MIRLREDADTMDGDIQVPQGYTVDQALEKIGFGKYQLKMISVLGFFGVRN